MDGSIVVILFAAVFVGAIIHGISGFAFGIIVLMVLRISSRIRTHWL